MDQERRSSVVGALVGLAGSADYLDRADAGRALANFAEEAEARESLLGLVLDAGDTFVTLATAEALLRRQDGAGFAVVAEALALADWQQRTYVEQAVEAVFLVFAAERDRAMGVCEALVLDASAEVRRGAVVLRQMLAEVRPLLFPQEPA
ncbi:hypothetical protein [Kribbella monticola]|uniref:hypothetical protein n=1 Tax=Kribbella monticola TaxID=2185285 RepID=UPI0018E54CB6|nr:hypothetical protein [Kribbella monticola]